MKSLLKVLPFGMAIAASCLPAVTQATNGIFPLGNGMIAHGVGGAGIANGVEAMSAVDNPALLSQVSNQYSVGFSLFNPNRSASVNPAVGYVESDSNLFVIPQGGYTANIDNKKDWGILVYALGGMNTDYPADLTGTRSGVDLMGVVIAPSLGYKLDNKTSIGVSLLLGYEKLITEGAFGGDHSDSATGWGVKLGIVSQVSPGTSIGMTYQSMMKMGEMDNHCNVGIFSGLTAMGYDCDLSMPDVLGVGVSHQLNNKLKFIADIQQVNWSNIEAIKEGFGWRDQTIVKFGFEYQYADDMDLRVGFNHGESPIPDDKVGNNVPAPAVTEDHLTLGFTKQMSKFMDISGYYSYVLENEQVQQGAAVPRVKMNQHALGIGWNWKY